MKIFSVRSKILLIGVCFSLTTAMSLPKIKTLPPIPVDCTGVTCSPSQCADEVISPGQCCPECPNGPNCLMPNNEIVAVGTETVDDQGIRCTCDGPMTMYCLDAPLYFDYPIEEELKPFTIPPPKRCLRDGKETGLSPGESSFKGCEYCYCDEEGHAVCFVMDCMMPMCADPVTNPGECCPTCPNGPNCLMPNNEILPVGQTMTDADNNTCGCEEGMRIYCLAPPVYYDPIEFPIDPPVYYDPIELLVPKKRCMGRNCRRHRKRKNQPWRRSRKNRRN